MLALIPHAGFFDAPHEINWDDLIPPDVPYYAIIAEEEMDEQNDSRKPVFDANATKLNTSLVGTYVKILGFIIPIDMTSNGVTSFVLVSYAGACIHTPPPPPNQLVLVTTKIPWVGDNLWDAVSVTGYMQNQLQSKDFAKLAIPYLQV